MSQSLPLSDFKWLKNEFLNELNENYKKLMEFGDNDEKGFIFEVDILIPASIHDKLNDYSIPESLKVTPQMLSPYCVETSKDLHINKDTVNKLVPNLMNKTNYVAHYRNIKNLIDLGCIITKVHRGIEFKQSKWLKTYIDFNTNERAKSTNNFEKDFFKLMNNSVFGKTMQNVRNQIDACM